MYTAEEKIELAEHIMNNAGTGRYYQGSVAERMIIKESNKHQPNTAMYYREIGVPYLKRGYAQTAYENYTKASEIDPMTWAGYMAYGWLYFYRDYKTTLDLVERLDSLTPNVVDYPQSTSVDYMRGISYMHLGEIDKAVSFLEKHLQYEIDNVGEKYIGVMSYMVLAIAHHRNNSFAIAEKYFAEGIANNPHIADIHYHRARNYVSQGNYPDAKKALALAQKWLDKGRKNTRPYVEEFFAIYQEDLDELHEKLYNR